MEQGIPSAGPESWERNEDLRKIEIRDKEALVFKMRTWVQSLCDRRFDRRSQETAGSSGRSFREDRFRRELG